MPVKTLVKTSVTFDSLAIEMSNIRDTKKALETREQEIREQVKGMLKDQTEAVTEHGVWRKTVAHRFSWGLEAIKRVLKDDWDAFVSPDPKLIKVLMEDSSNPKRAASLRRCATVATSETVALR